MTVAPPESSSQQDLRCMLSGVSLLSAECISLLLVPDVEGRWLPASLPLFGRYHGEGIIEDMGDGPGALLLTEALRAAVECGQLTAQPDRLPFQLSSLTHLEQFFGVVAAAHQHAPNAVRLGHQPLNYCMMSAHVAAPLMTGESDLLSQTPLEDVAKQVFRGQTGPVELYAAMRKAAFGLRCRFGLSFAALARLVEEMDARSLCFRPPEGGFSLVHQADQRERWLAEALERFAHDELLMTGLSDYLAEPDEG